MSLFRNAVVCDGVCDCGGAAAVAVADTAVNVVVERQLLQAIWAVCNLFNTVVTDTANTVSLRLFI